MVLALFLVTLVASSALGFVYAITKSPIEAAKQAKRLRAITEVLPDFNNNPYSDVFKIPSDGDTLYFYPGKMNDTLVGTAVETFTLQGFSGEIKLMVGLLPDGTINDVTVLEHKETPGLGDKMEKEKSGFSLQFQGRNPDSFRISVRKDGGDVEAITASTISSRAFCDAVTRACNAYKKGGEK
ncbi:MAG: RnfABCDGE type electron transport complex subunit G [Bacteroidales bacterium]|nr:MAG: RnfABCDGE type electron transport complex subunit G [Bacteroidales bacterium]